MAMALSPPACCTTIPSFSLSPSRVTNAGVFRRASIPFRIATVSPSEIGEENSRRGRARTVPRAIGNAKPLRASQHKQPAPAADPLRSFPWDIALKRFLARLSDLVWTALKWLTVPTLLVSSGSELSYTITQGKLLFVPVSMLVGVILAGVIKETAIELAPNLQKGFPWHLAAIGLLFALLKLPGPSYPFWGRVILPHVANGGLWQTCYFVWQSRKC